jgi:O-acetyl-ADP-ribose deacetylase (regulator of RNase III)
MHPLIRRSVGDLTVECVVGDIARQADCDAVVNAANAHLTTGGGVAGALHRAAGPGLAAEGRPLAPIRPGYAVVTSGHDLPNRWVIHCLGPVYGRDEPADRLLASCYVEALRRAEDELMKSIAFPAISTGAFGYPLKEAARIALRTVVDNAASHPSLRLVRFVLYDERAWRAHRDALREIIPEEEDR